jgi:hypothetical protein
MKKRKKKSKLIKNEINLILIITNKQIKQYFKARIYSKNCLTCFCIFFSKINTVRFLNFVRYFIITLYVLILSELRDRSNQLH